MAKSQYRTEPDATDKLPPGIPYIIGNEAAERFSFYGMRTILVIFMTKYLYLMSNEVQTAMSNAEATAKYHTFVSAVYFFPIFGALISDAFTGKYRIIMWVSVLYCIGHGCLAMMGGVGLTPAMWLWVGLIMIAVSSGGIKPCVSAHVGDQFGPGNRHLMSRVYQWFYFSINLGSTFSTLLTPWLLEWYGPHVAFGVPGVLMTIATIMFWLGRNKFIHVPPAGKKFLQDVFSTDGLLTIGKLLLVYVSIAVFWALFDQTSSAWVLQAENMDREWLGIVWLESQIQVANPILVLILIPVFQLVIYPAINKVFRLTPLRKISLGLFLTVFAFALSAIVQQWIDTGQRPSIGWQITGFVIITAAEVMVSITGLEFSYSQAPKSMKSIVMAAWLSSVFLGNFVTAAVNSAIQVPGANSVVSAAAKLTPDDEPKTLDNLWQVRAEEPVLKETTTDDDKDAKVPKVTVRLAGADGEFSTDDDILMNFGEYRDLHGIVTPENETLETAKKKIDNNFFASAKTADAYALPDNKTGGELIDGITDRHGNPIRYERITRDRYRLVSAGADKTFDTQWDLFLLAKVNRAKAPSADGTAKPLTWRERRIIELKGDEGKQEVEAARGEIPETEIEAEFAVGGRVTLEGAGYYWFWTYVMLGAAVVFVPIAYFYRDQSQLFDHEGDTDPGVQDDHSLLADVDGDK